jgi:hypothetical protein
MKYQEAYDPRMHDVFEKSKKWPAGACLPSVRGDLRRRRGNSVVPMYRQLPVAALGQRRDDDRPSDNEL